MNDRTRAVLSLSTTVFFVMLGVSIITPSLPLYARAFKASDVMIGLLISAFGLARVFLDLPAGLIFGKVGGKRLMQIGLLLIFASSIAAGLATNYAMLLAMRVVEGVGSAFFIVSSSAVVVSISSLGDRGKFMSLYTAMILVGASAGPVIGGVITGLWGANVPFFAYAIVVLVGMLFVHFALKDIGSYYRTSMEGPRLQGLRQSFSDRSLMLVGFTTFSVAFMWTGIDLTVAPLFAYDNLNLSPVLFGTTVASATLANLGITIFSGNITDKRGRRTPVIASLMVTAGTVVFIPFSSDYKSFLAIMAISGAAAGFWGQTTAWAADLAQEGRMGVAVGLNRTLGDLGFVLGPLVLAYLAQISRNPLIQPLPFFASVIVLIAAGVLLVAARDPVALSRKAGTEVSSM